MSRRITVPVGGNLVTRSLHFCKYVFSHLQCRIVSHVALKGRARTYIHTSSLIVGFAGPHKRQVGTQSYVPKLSLPNGSRDLGGIAKNTLENLPCSRIKKKPKPFSRYAPCGWSDVLNASTRRVVVAPWGEAITESRMAWKDRPKKPKPYRAISPRGDPVLFFFFPSIRFPALSLFFSF